jgi:hypothetical protein
MKILFQGVVVKDEPDAGGHGGVLGGHSGAGHSFLKGRLFA